MTPGYRPPSIESLSKARSKLSLFDPGLLRAAAIDAFRKLNPSVQIRNPVMFVVYVGSLFTSGLWVQALLGRGEAPAWFIGNVTLWLWFTVLFANFAEALAEGRSKAQRRPLGDCVRPYGPSG